MQSAAATAPAAQSCCSTRHNRGNRAARTRSTARCRTVAAARNRANTTGPLRRPTTEHAFAWDLARVGPGWKPRGAGGDTTRGDDDDASGPCVDARGAARAADRRGGRGVPARRRARRRRGFHVAHADPPVHGTGPASRRLATAARDALRSGQFSPAGYIRRTVCDSRDDLAGLNLSTVPQPRWSGREHAQRRGRRAGEAPQAGTATRDDQRQRARLPRAVTVTGVRWSGAPSLSLGMPARRPPGSRRAAGENRLGSRLGDMRLRQPGLAGDENQAASGFPDGRRGQARRRSRWESSGGGSGGSEMSPSEMRTAARAGLQRSAAGQACCGSRAAGPGAAALRAAARRPAAALALVTNTPATTARRAPRAAPR
ncbi:hypothetical protein HBB16_09345 [Pseudonocardia sp. MCCB 268]|nr:hypothetical protein [Pseudonocardia cytotoxica]